MAKIKDLELKSVKEFIGFDGSGVNANLYYKGKKVAFAIDSGNGGDLTIEWNATDDIQNEIKKLVHQYYTDNPVFLVTDEENELKEIIEELLELRRYEQLLKKGKKEKSSSALLVLFFHKRAEEYNFKKPPSSYILPFWSEAFQNRIIKQFTPIEFKVYKELTDFIIE